jgi:ubiquinone/menaquinone biosynthesis C-methylase UbiE
MTIYFKAGNFDFHRRAEEFSPCLPIRSTQPCMSTPTIIQSYDKDAETYNSTWTDYLEHSLARPLSTTIAFIESSPRPLRILDVGCGTGLFIQKLLTTIPTDLENITIIGIDPAKEMLSQARNILNPTSCTLEFYCESALDLSCVESNSIDIVVSTNALHFMSNDPSLPLAQISRVLRSGGRFILTDWSAEYRVIRFICWGLERFGSGYAADAYTREQVENACLGVGLKLGEGEEDAKSEEKMEQFKISFWWGLLFGVFVKR